MSLLQEAGHLKNTVVLIFWHIQFLHLMNSEVAWVPLSLKTQVQPQIIFDPYYVPDYLSIFCDYAHRILLKHPCLSKQVVLL